MLELLGNNIRIKVLIKKIVNCLGIFIIKNFNVGVTNTVDAHCSEYRAKKRISYSGPAYS